LRADEGTVRVGGVDVAGRTTAELARDVGYVFQDPGAMLFADTVREECSFGPASAGHPPEVVRRRVDAALRRVHLEDLADAAPGALSLGQKKRVTLAAIAAGGVSVWLVDEPTAGLDPAGVEDFLDALGEAGEGGDAATVILATHDVDLALTFADRVAIVERGKVVAVGAPAELLTDPGWLERARLCTTSLVEANRGRFARGLAPLSARALAREEGA
jgi:energy-coupling factor transporter ATP-binding protein EcfA2